MSGEVLWTPSPDRAARSSMARYLRWLEDRTRQPFPDHDALWAWSVNHLEEFWASIWDYFDITASAPYQSVLSERKMPGARWFTGARLNWAEHALRHPGENAPALLAVAEDADPIATSWDELRRQVGAFAAFLREAGVRPGDRVAGYLPNIPQAAVALLGTAAVGAVWAGCAPDFGPGGALGRLQQVRPSVFVAVDGYRFGGRWVDRRAVAAEVRAGLPTVREVVHVDYAFPDEPPAPDLRATASWSQVMARSPDLRFEQVDFDHPLWILYSSGTTGLPKGLVQGHGGILLEHLKFLGLYVDVGPARPFFFHTSTAWMVWNALVSGLLMGSTLVLYDGSPAQPDLGALWRVAERTKAKVMGVGASFVGTCEKAGVEPGRSYDLSALGTLIVTGSPLPPSGARWIYEHVSPDVRLDTASGGTDVCTPFVGGSEILPVHAGEITARWAGVRAEAWNEAGQPVIGEVGELVITEPMPSMPLYFWDDPDGKRYRDSYFDVWPGVWRHGDWVTITERGTVIIHGRSDATINRHGVRMGSSDIYEAVERMPEVAESLVVGVETGDGGYYMPLFVVPAAGVPFDDDLRRRIADTIRREVSPRHVPDEIVEAPGVPHTRTGKRLEVPVKRLLQGLDLDRAVNLGSVDSPDVIRWYANFAARRAAQMTT